MLRTFGKVACVVVAMLVGAAVGHASVELGEKEVRAITGAVVAGLVGALVVLRLGTRRAGWTKLTIKVPLVGDAEFDMAKTEDRAFALAESQRAAGWAIYVELVTRIAIQSVPEGAAPFRSALTSLHTLMQNIREHLAKFPPGEPPADPKDATIETLTVWILNAVRSFLTRWHPRLAAHEASGLPEAAFPDAEAAKCHEDLEKLRATLRQYAEAMSQLLRVQPPDAFLAPRG